MQLRVAVSSRGLLLPVCVRVCLASHRASPRLSLRNWAKRGANIPEDLVMEASWEAVPRERGETAGCAFDVRFFDDPDAGSLRSHCGTHPEIMERFVLNQHFKPLLLAVKRRLHAIAQQGHDTVRLIFFLQQGQASVRRGRDPIRPVHGRRRGLPSPRRALSHHAVGGGVRV